MNIAQGTLADGWAAVLALLALLLGAALSWWRLAERYGADLKAAQVQTAALGERLSAREQELERERTRLRDLEAALTAARNEAGDARTQLAAAETALNELRAQLSADPAARLREAFAVAAGEALTRNQEHFLTVAKEVLQQFQDRAQGELDRRRQAVDAVVQPLQEALARLSQQIAALEQTRAGAYAGLSEQIRQLAETGSRLQQETGRLAHALRAPATRGMWGELQLRRVVELAGMQAHVDFDEQVTVQGGDGLRRPDLVVHLPGGKQVVIDAKAPLLAYLEAVEAADPAARQESLRRHAQAVAEHVVALGQKAYWEQFPRAPEFVVLFLPGEPLFSAALEQDPNLIEKAAERRVILATPTTLIALLRAVAYGWQQAEAEENARRILSLGQELYRRLLTLTGHLQQLGRHLEATVGDYNRMVGSLESRVLVTARRLKEMGGGEDLEALQPVAPVPRLPETLVAEAAAEPFSEPSA